MNGVVKKTVASGLAAFTLSVAVATSSMPAFAGGGHGPPGGSEGGRGPPGVCRNGPCDPPHGSTVGGGNKGSKCKLNGEGCGKKF
jgi:hypothetical protein